jgi:hypothetical protein
MTIEDKINLNKDIRKYNGENSFLLSLKKQLKNNQYLERVEVGNRKIKVLSERQYKTAISLLE